MVELLKSKNKIQNFKLEKSIGKAFNPNYLTKLRKNLTKFRKHEPESSFILFLGQLKQASNIHTLIVWIIGVLAALGVIGSIIAIISKETSKSEFTMFGVTLSTNHVGVTIFGISLVTLYFTVKSVLKNQFDLANLSIPKMDLVDSEVRKIYENETQKSDLLLYQKTNVLIVVDIQNDFITGPLEIPEDQSNKLLPLLSAAIARASANGFLIVFTRDWHPDNHISFKKNGGVHDTHCVQGTRGADLHSSILRSQNSIIIDFGMEPASFGYSPFENPSLQILLSSPQIDTVYVAGIALEYCVQATCLGALRLGKKVIAVERLIGDTGKDPQKIAEVWGDLSKAGVECCSNIPSELTSLVSH